MEGYKHSLFFAFTDVQMSEIDAPDIAKDYYGLPKAAKLRDVIIAVRQDEQGYSDTNHEIADALAKG